MKKLIFGLAITVFVTNSFSQQNNKKRNFICFTPTTANTINGLAIGLWNRPATQSQQNFNGINLEILGCGWVTPFLGLDDAGYITQTKHNINGLSVGLTLLNGKVNGFAISLTINTTFYFNGVKIGLINVDLHSVNGIEVGLVNANDHHKGLGFGFYNQANKTHGIQIGIINKTNALQGLQIGLINSNDSRTLPLINWSSKRK
jgi:hypothetical protein